MNTLFLKAAITIDDLDREMKRIGLDEFEADMLPAMETRHNEIMSFGLTDEDIKHDAQNAKLYDNPDYTHFNPTRAKMYSYQLALRTYLRQYISDENVLIFC